MNKENGWNVISVERKLNGIIEPDSISELNAMVEEKTAIQQAFRNLADNIEIYARYIIHCDVLVDVHTRPPLENAIKIDLYYKKL